ncbi:urease accessory protein D isoform X3 [Phoenix dactylifera]|uniref:Urease accessory protein D isoform X3 n=1 Tax=Phoenix dactylifera TaxID=42345 RepID=A0A8B9A201_PHODC|nr:urease accessory protein D isoform X3 [Phoenix dactylifera]
MSGKGGERGERKMETGIAAVEKVGGRSTVTRCFSKYPLKLIVPNKVGSSKTDAVWIYTLSYGGGIVSVYKSVDSKCSEQVLEARIGRNALLAVIPDPVTCFSTARYSQKQVFRVFSDSNLVIVDWITSGRHESGEKWEFELYRSTNQIFLEEDQPLFLDSVLLEQASTCSIAERMQEYHVIAMVIILGPMLKHVQNQVQDEVKKMMSRHFRVPTPTAGHYMRSESQSGPTRPALVASCSAFGPQAIGVVVRIAAVTTESVYMFLRHHLATLEPFLGVIPYG